MKLSATGIALAALLGFGVLTALPSLRAQTPNSELAPEQFTPQQLVETVWRLVNQTCFVPKFWGQNWQTLRQHYLSRSYPSAEAAYKRMQDLLDRLSAPGTRFATPEEHHAIKVDPSKAGIGLQFIETAKRQVAVVAALQGSPAAIAGILPQDIVKSINGQSVQGMGIYKVAKLLQGAPATEVRLGLRRGNQDMTVVATRQKITIEPLRTQL